ncbi:hypothetical protein G7046_g5746 [Stylonectria norvegica]|nr:hypothetical protein G7046_g5746 [Stylonectria norvegica]
MYEIFLTGLVAEKDFDAARAVLGGLCGMDAWESVYRVLYFQGPPRPTGISNQASIDKPIRKENGFLWKDLHQSLSRQSFLLQTRYEVLKSRDFGLNAPATDLDSVSGTLRWTNFPDPPHDRPVLIQRKKVELWDQKKLSSLMRDNNHQFKTEGIEEVYHFFREEVEFCLVRDYFSRPLEDYVPLEQKTQPAVPSATLPAWEDLTPIDLEKRWYLFVKIHVLQDDKPDELRKAQDQLLAIRDELDGVIEFLSIDRKVHDTRVAQQQQGIQALPQKVTIGKN